MAALADDSSSLAVANAAVDLFSDSGCLLPAFVSVSSAVHCFDFVIDLVWSLHER